MGIWVFWAFSGYFWCFWVLSCVIEGFWGISGIFGDFGGFDVFRVPRGLCLLGSVILCFGAIAFAGFLFVWWVLSLGLILGLGISCEFGALVVLRLYVSTLGFQLRRFVVLWVWVVFSDDLWICTL